MTLQGATEGQVAKFSSPAPHWVLAVTQVPGCQAAPLSGERWTVDGGHTTQSKTMPQIIAISDRMGLIAMKRGNDAPA